jgi:HEAT repeat protein
MSDHIPASLSRMMGGDPIEAMEIAKQIVGGDIPVVPRVLGQIAANGLQPKWTRIAAIYSLGFLGNRNFLPELRDILSDNKIDDEIRSYAAEALGNIGDEDSVSILRDVLRSHPTGELLASCNYALNELNA